MAVLVCLVLTVCFRQTDGTLTRGASCSESPTPKGNSAASQGPFNFYNQLIGNGSSSVAAQRKKPVPAVSANAKKLFDEV